MLCRECLEDVRGKLERERESVMLTVKVCTVCPELFALNCLP
mgnify:CR=1 FL=1